MHAQRPTAHQDVLEEEFDRGNSRAGDVCLDGRAKGGIGYWFAVQQSEGHVREFYGLGRYRIETISVNLHVHGFSCDGGIDNNNRSRGIGDGAVRIGRPIDVHGVGQANEGV